MKRTLALTLLPLLLLLTAACGTNNTSSEETPTPTAETAQEPTHDTGVHTAKLDETVTLTGIHGTPIKAILTGIYYGDAHAKDTDTPDTYAVALAFTLVALGQPDQLPAPIDRATWAWSSNGQQRVSHDSSVPWDGCTNAYLPTSTLTPGTPHKAIVDLTTPARGGTLTYSDANGTVIQWKLPTKNTGTGTEPAAHYLTNYC